MKPLVQLFFIFFFHRIASAGIWQNGVETKSNLRRDDLEIISGFSGHPEDHLSLLKSTPGDSLFVGARDGIWNLRATDLKTNFVVNWTTSSYNREICQIKGQKDSDCFNYVKVLHGPIPPKSQIIKKENEEKFENSTRREVVEQEESDVYIVCGTNAFKPTCRYYSPDFKNYTTEFPGVGYVPFDPTHQSTSVLHSSSVYSGTVADFGGTDALIYKYPLRTEQNDLKHLNSPSFVSSLSFGEFSLFFFREFAIEHSNCGKAVFSRVGRICRHDNGSRKHKDRFSTFLKARLNCSVGGEFPFYLDHIRGTTEIFSNKALGNEMIYGVFTTAPNSIRGSAVCAFSTDEILRAFDGPFKGQTSYNSNWLPVPESDVPENTSSHCSENIPNSNSVASFLKAHPLMDHAVQGKLIEISTYQDFFTTVEVDHSPNIEPYHIVYIGTESGKVLKSVVNASAGSLDKEFNPDESVISQSWVVFPGVPIKTLRLLSPKRLLVATETNMVILGVENCEKFQHCSKCVEIRDPHCGWDVDRGACVSKNPEALIQDVNAGDINLCPHDERKNEVPIEANHLKSINEKEDLKNKQQQQQQKGEDCASLCGGANVVDSNTDKDLNSLGFDSSNDHQTFITLNDSLLDNEIPSNNFQQDFKSSFVKSSDDGAGGVSSHSVVVATTSSAILSLLIGFALGFIASKYVSSRNTKKTKDASSNAQLANEAAQRLTTKPSIDFVVNVPTANKNPLKNNLNSETTLERTVKKMYI